MVVQGSSGLPDCNCRAGQTNSAVTGCTRKKARLSHSGPFLVKDRLYLVPRRAEGLDFHPIRGKHPKNEWKERNQAGPVAPLPQIHQSGDVLTPRKASDGVRGAENNGRVKRKAFIRQTTGKWEVRIPLNSDP